MKRNWNLVLTMLAAGAILAMAACDREEADTTVVCSVQAKDADGTVLQAKTDTVVVSDGDAECDAVVHLDSVGVDPILSFHLDSVAVDARPR